MKIAFVYSGYSNYNKSGIIVLVESMVGFFRERGHQVHLYSPEEKNLLPAFFVIFRTILKPILGRKFKNWLTKVNPDVVIIQGIYLPEARYFAYSKKRNFKLILIQHGFPDLWWIRIISFFYIRIFGKRVFKKADKILTVSNYTYKKVLPFVKASKVAIIHSGIDMKRFHKLDDDEKKEALLRLSIKKPLVLGVGRLIFLKNFNTLVRAVRLIPEISLILVGGGFNSLSLHILIKFLKIEKRVKILKHVSTKNLVSLYNIADVTVLPSLAEGLGLVLVESLACGTPVIGSKMGGITDIIEQGKNGLFLENPHNSKDLAENIRKILGDKELYNKMAEYARKSVEEKFNIDKLLIQFEKEINNLI